MTSLRLGRPEDAYPLWLWANDSASREASGNRALISWVDHLDWYRARLESPDALILIGEKADGCPVGAIRFETADRWQRARLSYVVAPESRRQGIGHGLLQSGIAELLRRAPAVVIEAMVRGGNAPSVRLFQRLGWEVSSRPDGQLLFLGPKRGSL